MTEPISHMFKRRKIEQQMKRALANQDLVLDDGSGQQVGTYQQGGLFTSGKETSTAQGQKEEQLKALAKRKKAEDAIKSFRKSLKEGKFFGEKEDELDIDLDQEKSNDKKTQTSSEPKREVKAFKSSQSADASTAAMENAQSMAQLTDNPYAQGGAALLGVLQAEQKRKDLNRQIEYQAKMRGAQGKEQLAGIYRAMAESMKGMLK